MKNYYTIRLTIHSILAASLTFITLTTHEFTLLVSNVFIYLLSFVLDLWYPNYPKEELPWQNKLGRLVLWIILTSIIIVMVLSFLGMSYEATLYRFIFQAISLIVIAVFYIIVFVDYQMNDPKKQSDRTTFRNEVQERIRQEKLEANENYNRRLTTNKKDYEEFVVNKSQKKTHGARPKRPRRR